MTSKELSDLEDEMLDLIENSRPIIPMSDLQGIVTAFILKVRAIK